MKKIILFFILILTIGGFLFFWSDITDLYLRLSLQLPGIEKGITDLIQEVEKQVSTPPPLRATEETPQSYLTKAGVIQWTNLQRENYGLPPLKENERLDLSAAMKVEDMFDKQYFAHDSPSGVKVGDLAEKVGYEFIAIGENLALGNFENDEALLKAWMDSPGHRANILNSQYQEIGVAVLKGAFEGNTTWLAVQHFGLPLSACSQPSTTFKTEIESNENEIKELQNTLQSLRIEIQNFRPKRGPAYIQKVEEYNNLIVQYNNLVAETQALVSQYNNQVKSFNECVAGVTM